MVEEQTIQSEQATTPPPQKRLNAFERADKEVADIQQKLAELRARGASLGNELVEVANKIDNELESLTVDELAALLPRRTALEMLVRVSVEKTRSEEQDLKLNLRHAEQRRDGLTGRYYRRADEGKRLRPLIAELKRKISTLPEETQGGVAMQYHTELRVWTEEKEEYERQIAVIDAELAEVRDSMIAHGCNPLPLTEW